MGIRPADRYQFPVRGDGVRLGEIPYVVYIYGSG
jgi:hypothetical protein